MYQVVDWATAVLPEDRPRHLLGIGDVDDLLRGVELGIDTFDCAMPTRIAPPRRRARARPANRWRLDVTGSPKRRSQALLMDDCPCPLCTEGFTVGYLAYLHRIKEQTGPRLLTLHNLAYTRASWPTCVSRSKRDAPPSASLSCAPALHRACSSIPTDPRVPRGAATWRTGSPSAERRIRRVAPPEGTRIEVVRGERPRYHSFIRRVDGVVVRLEGGSYNKVGGDERGVPHDIAHFLVEETLALRGGLWGVLLGRGIVQNAAPVSGRQRPHAADRARAITRASSRALWEAEVVVRAVADLALAGRRVDLGVLARACGGTYWQPASIDDERLAALAAGLQRAGDALVGARPWRGCTR